MELFLYIYIFIIGLILGSFFNVVGLRVPVNQSIVQPGSHCPTCKHFLTAYELVPVLSYIFLKGRCRKCSNRISFFYPFMEFLTAILFVWAAITVGFNIELIMACAFISLLIIITISDLHYMLIPDKVLLFFALLFLILHLFIPQLPWWESFAGAAIGFFLLLAIAWISKGGMGGGDVKLFAVLGLVLGIKGVLVAFFLSTFFGALIGGVGMLFGKIKRKNPIPFGPFIAIGAIVSYFYSSLLIDWYVTTFL